MVLEDLDSNQRDFYFSLSVNSVLPPKRRKKGITNLGVLWRECQVFDLNGSVLERLCPLQALISYHCGKSLRDDRNQISNHAKRILTLLASLTSTTALSFACVSSLVLGSSLDRSLINSHLRLH